MLPIRTPRLSRIALALVFLASIAHAAATLGAPPVRYEMRDEALEQAPEQRSPRYEMRAAPRPAEPAPAKGGRYRAKAALGPDSVATTCGVVNDLFANGFESP